MPILKKRNKVEPFTLFLVFVQFPLNRVVFSRFGPKEGAIFHVLHDLIGSGIKPLCSTHLCQIYGSTPLTGRFEGKSLSMGHSWALTKKKQRKIMNPQRPVLPFCTVQQCSTPADHFVQESNRRKYLVKNSRFIAFISQRQYEIMC